MGLLLGGGGIMHRHTSTGGGAMKKYLFGLGAMLVGAGSMFVLMHGEVNAEDVPKIKCESFEGETGVDRNTIFSYCRIKELTCVISRSGMSCIRGSMF